MKKSLILVSLVVLLSVFGNSTFAAAQTIDEKIQEKDREIETIVKDQQSAETYLAELNNRISTLQNEYQNALNEKNSLEEELNSLRNEITELEQKIERRDEVIDKQARNAQLNQLNGSVLSLLINSESLTDVVNKTIGMTKLVNANNEIMSAQKDDKEKLEILENDIENKLIEAEKKTNELEEKEMALANDKLDQDIKIKGISATLATEKAEKEKFEIQKIEAEKKKQEELRVLEEEKRKEAEAQAILEAQEAELIKKETSNVNSTNQVVDSKPSISNPNITDVKPAPTPSTSGWRAPVSNIIVTSPFGSRPDPTGISGTFHNGIDMGGTSNTPILATRSGTVLQAAFEATAGNYIIIDHGDGYYSYYFHMSSLVASAGQTVSAGQTIGVMGTTGNSTGVHLHFSVATSQNWTGFVDPAPLLGI